MGVDDPSLRRFSLAALICVVTYFAVASATIRSGLQREAALLVVSGGVMISVAVCGIMGFVVRNLYGAAFAVLAIALCLLALAELLCP